MMARPWTEANEKHYQMRKQYETLYAACEFDKADEVVRAMLTHGGSHTVGSDPNHCVACMLCNR